MRGYRRINEVPAGGEAPRTFSRLAVFAAVAGMLALVLPAGVARAAGHTDALLLSCMDYRLVDDVEKYMSARSLRDKYDHIILAGAALGAVTNKYPSWNKTFWEHLDIAITLHQIHKVIVMDHRDCGAYKVILGEDFGKVPIREREIHAQKLNQLYGLIKRKHPKLEVELLLMGLDGKVEPVARSRRRVALLPARR